MTKVGVRGVPLDLAANGDFAAQGRILLKFRIRTNSTMKNPKMNTVFFLYCKWEVGQYQPKVESLKTIQNGVQNAP